MWDTATSHSTGELICYIFHHWSGQRVDQSEIVVSNAGCTPIPREEADEEGLPAWYLFRSIPQRLCPHAGRCARCNYALGEIAEQPPVDHIGYSLAPA